MTQAVNYALQSITFTIFALSIIAALGLRPKYLELTSHFRVQYLLAALLCLGGSIVLLHWWCAIIATTSVLINWVPILPLLRTNQRAESRPAVRFKILLANVNHLNREFGKCIEQIREENPDVAIVQEIDEPWAEALVSLEPCYPFAVVHPVSNGSGLALFSRTPLQILEADLPEQVDRPGIMVRVETGASELHILSIHPRAPIRSGHFELRNRMLAAGAALIGSAPRPRILVGDLNTTMWSPYFKDLERTSGLRSVRDAFGVVATWPTFMGLKSAMIPIDHCLVSDDIHVLSVSAGDKNGSDHLPLIVEVGLPIQNS